jgi:hypothetical protein
MLVWCVAAGATAGLLAGCGSGGSTAVPPTTPATTPATHTTATTTVTPPKHASPATIAKCRAVVAERTGLTATVKAQLAELCEKAATENPVQLRATAAEVCAELVNNSQLPAGPDKTEALAACKAA